MSFYPRKLKPGDDAITATGSELNITDGATATAAEVNLLDDKVASYSFSAAAGASTVCEVTITPTDAAGSAIADVRPFMVWLSDDADGEALTGTSASSTVQVKSGEGDDFGALEAKKCLVVQPKAAGTYVLEITDSSKTAFYVAAGSLDGKVVSVSDQLETADYGSA